jgi:hypothetical protein
MQWKKEIEMGRAGAIKIWKSQGGILIRRELSVINLYQMASIRSGLIKRAVIMRKENES